MGAESTVELRVSVPFLDLGRVHRELKGDLLADLAELVDSGAFTNGPHVRQFEEAFAQWCGASRCVGTASGLDALRLALIAAGIERDDEVIVPANTFAATFEAVSQAGGRPVPVDVTERDYNLDPEAVGAAVTPRTRFLLPVHLYGQMADMRTLGTVAARHDLRIIEDACQAHGATRDGLRAGTAGSAGAFSFYPGKNLGAMGDAGALLTDDADLAFVVSALREHGQREKYRHDLQGYTARLDTVQALVLLRKLPELERWNEERRAVARRYTAALTGVGDLRLPPVVAGSEPVWHLYVLRTAAPERLAAFLAERGIGSGRHYPAPVHLSPAYGELGLGPGAFPVTEALAAECLSLPMFPGMSEAEIGAVVDAVGAYFERA